MNAQFLPPPALAAGLLAAALLAPAASGQAPAALVAGRVAGAVTAVDAAKRAVTVTPRQSPTPVTFTLAPAAKIMKLAPAALADLQAKEAVQINSPAGADGGAISAANITILPELPKRARGRAVDGTVVTTAPALTVTTLDGRTVTVGTTAATRVWRTAPGAFGDIAVGSDVQARVSGDAPNQVASDVVVLPARQARRARRAPAP